MSMAFNLLPVISFCGLSEKNTVSNFKGWRDASADFSEDINLIPSTYMVAHSSL